MRAPAVIALALAGATAASAARWVEPGIFDAFYSGGSHFTYKDPLRASPPTGITFSDEDMTCAVGDGFRGASIDRRIRGVNMGGFLVLEPWITPSLFYQFLGADKRHGDAAPNHTALDTYTFCQVLGAQEANKQLRRHWAAWVNETDIKKLAELKITWLRVPVADWMWRPYGPYVGCTDGSVDELDRLLELAARYGMRVLLDVHGVEGSQNGLDNSGRAANIHWTSVASRPPIGITAFSHWDRRAAEWIGAFDADRLAYTELDWGRVHHTLDVVREIVDAYKAHPAVAGFEPLNEPWQFTPLGPLMRYYWEAYKVVARRAPHWSFFMHDSFRLWAAEWATFMEGCPAVLMDTHIYQAWDPPTHEGDFYLHACEARRGVKGHERRAMPLVVGEWSLATDNCAMWLNGFNDNLPGYPLVQCDYVPCPEPYMGPEQPGAPPSKVLPPQGPSGSGQSTPSHAMCPIDKSWADDDNVTRALGYKKVHAFSKGHGWFFWNFKTELEPKWDYIRAAERGWLPHDALGAMDTPEVQAACDDEERAAFICEAKPRASRAELQKAVGVACLQRAELNLTHACAAAEGGLGANASTDQLRALATDVFAAWWRAGHASGAQCDFNGTAQLVDLEPDPAWARSVDRGGLSMARDARPPAPAAPSRLRGCLHGASPIANHPAAVALGAALTVAALAAAYARRTRARLARAEGPWARAAHGLGSGGTSGGGSALSAIDDNASARMRLIDVDRLQQ